MRKTTLAWIGVVSLSLFVMAGLFMAAAVTMSGYTVLVPVSPYQKCGVNCMSLALGELTIFIRSELLTPRGRLEICIDHNRDQKREVSLRPQDLALTWFDRTSESWRKSSMKEFKPIAKSDECGGSRMGYVVDFDDSWISPSIPFPENTKFELSFTVDDNPFSVGSLRIPLASRTMRPMNLLFGFH